MLQSDGGFFCWFGSFRFDDRFVHSRSEWTTWGDGCGDGGGHTAGEARGDVDHGAAGGAAVEVLGLVVGWAVVFGQVVVIGDLRLPCFFLVVRLSKQVTPAVGDFGDRPQREIEFAG